MELINYVLLIIYFLTSSFCVFSDTQFYFAVFAQIPVESQYLASVCVLLRALQTKQGQSFYHPVKLFTCNLPFLW